MAKLDAGSYFRYDKRQRQFFLIIRKLRYSIVVRFCENERSDILRNDTMMALSDVLNNKFDELVENCMSSGVIDLNLYQEYDVKRGLRDSTGKGVLTGLTEISDVSGYDIVGGVKEPADGKLYYQGYDVMELTGSSLKKRFAFEETTYLLLFGKLPKRVGLINKRTLNGYKTCLRKISFQILEG